MPCTAVAKTTLDTLSMYPFAVSAMQHICARSPPIGPATQRGSRNPATLFLHMRVCELQSLQARRHCTVLSGIVADSYGITNIRTNRFQDWRSKIFIILAASYQVHDDDYSDDGRLVTIAACSITTAQSPSAALEFVQNSYNSSVENIMSNLELK